MIAGVSLAGAVFFALLNNHYLGNVISRTMGPYSDVLSQHVLDNPYPNVLSAIAQTHRVTIMLEFPDKDLLAFDAQGNQLSSAPSGLLHGQVHASRTGPDGSRVTFFWKVSSFGGSSLPFLAGLLVMVFGVVGSAFWFLQRQLKPLSWLHGGVDAVSRGEFNTRVPVVRDDEIGQIAEAFNGMAGRVGEMIDDRDRLLADVSHELRSPIARMKVALEFVPEGSKRDALSRDLNEMQNLITVLLEREALRSRAGRLEGEQFDLAALAGEIVAASADRAPGVELVCDGEALIHADPALLRLLIRNLLDNAIKFSRPDSDKVQLKLEAGSDPIVMRVSDDGIGIPAEDSKKLFEPFVKLDQARGHRSGYGIGLNLCQRIVHLHGGTITISPGDPQGTEVLVTLPCRS